MLNVQDADLHHLLEAADDAQVPVSQIDRTVRVLRMKEVIQRTRLSRATLYSLILSDPGFPSKIRLSARAVGFLEHEIVAWILARREGYRQCTKELSALS